MPEQTDIEQSESYHHDPVNHPSHYNDSPAVCSNPDCRQQIECIDVVRHMSFNLGNTVKYLWRAGSKEGAPPLQDLRKAAWYLNDEIERLAHHDTD